MSVIPGTNVSLPQEHEDFDFLEGKLTQDIWADKYKYGNERNFFDTALRVVRGIFAEDTSEEGQKALELAYQFMIRGLLMPAGRILAGAGTSKHVSLLNCFVNSVVEDSMVSITEACSHMVLTMQMGGGMGTPFGNIRPFGAKLKRTGEGSKASGPLPFIEAFDGWGKTVRSAGDRRGAQMWTISDTHPNLLQFVHAKNKKDYLTQGNMSINISDAFMEAKDADEDWALYFRVEPAFERPPELIDMDFEDEIDGQPVTQYVYSLHKARDIWEEITRNTYEYSEPGILFMDRVNELNNLHYLETIDCTNPCGEQPLPPDNACDLGHVVLARMVRAPFTEDASFDFDLLRSVVRVLQRFLDNVWDVTLFPLEQQREECLSKRRTGLGYTGLADVFAQMGYRYGSARSADLAERIQQVICEEAYNTSIDLAIEKGSFPLFDADQYLAPNTFAGSRLPRDIQDRIRKHGIRNGVLLTIAPTGTSSIVYGNPQGGLEPFFALLQKRKVKQEDDSFKEYIDGPYACRLYNHLYNTEELPPYFNSVMAGTVKVEDHILIQSRVQRWVDASISKTTNIPKDMPYEDFVKVYDLAYTSGCKGCTTYRPSDVRGSILEDASVASPTVPSESVGNAQVPTSLHVPDRPRQRSLIMEGSTYQIKWPRRSSAMYLTINSDIDGAPFEVFITGKDGTASEWTTALSLMITGLFRKGGDTAFVADELKQIQSAAGDGTFIKMPHWNKGQYIPSLPAYLGHLIEYHFMRQTDKELDTITETHAHIQSERTKHEVADLGGSKCPNCSHPTGLTKQQGCDNCLSCGYSKC